MEELRVELDNSLEAHELRIKSFLDLDKIKKNYEIKNKGINFLEFVEVF